MEEDIKGTASCLHCQTPMELLTVKKYSGRWPAALVVTGVFCCLFLIGALIGIPILLMGIYMATSQETISRCPSCGHYFRVWMQEGVSG